MKKRFTTRTWAFGTIIGGWLLCTYLALRYTQLKNPTTKIPDICKTIFGNSCDQSLLESVAWQLGYPLAFWGFTYFGLLALLLSFNKSMLDRAAGFLAAFGVGISIILMAMILRSKLICPLCLIIHFINFILLVLLFLTVKSPINRNKQKLAPWNPSYLLWCFLLLLVILTGGFTEVKILKASLAKEAEVRVDEVAKQFQTEKVHNFSVSPLSAHVGPEKAPIQVVVFSSFQCPACQGFAPTLKNLYAKFGDKIRISFRNFPLSTACNPKLTVNMQPQSCSAALAAMAAGRQNRFWDYHDQLFESDLVDDENTLVSIAKKIGLNMSEWEQDRHSNYLKNQLLEDIEAGYRTEISGTPSVFINGRAVKSFQEKVLNFLIEMELKNQKLPLY